MRNLYLVGGGILVVVAAAALFFRYLLRLSDLSSDGDDR